MSENTTINLPQHKDPKPDRTASAPYNFIPLPETIVPAVDDANRLPDHDCYSPNRRTGYFDITLVTKSPLYIRCPFTLEEFIREQEDDETSLPYKERVKNIPDFFYTKEKSKKSKPVIPGSSLRGMLRILLEIVSYGKMKLVTDEKLLLQKKRFDKSPLDNVPPELRCPKDVDYAEAIFGFTRTDEELKYMANPGVKLKQGEKGRAYAGRVSVTDACLLGEQQDIWWSSEPITPKILASPKPTAFQHYLVQTDSKKEKLKDYDSGTPEETVIRGYKRYWLQGERNQDDIKDEAEKDSTQHTQFNALRAGVKFKFRFYFENLSDEELGALCWILQPQGDPDKEYCHQLGMGKPLGMGAVKLDAQLCITDRTKRYASLFSGDSWETGISCSGLPLSSNEIIDGYMGQFEKHVLKVVGRKTKQSSSSLKEFKRIGMLLKMMEWPGYPAVSGGPLFLEVRENRPNTRYMKIEPNEYKERPVLPTSAAFGSLTSDIEAAVSKGKIAKGASIENVKSRIGALQGKGEVSRFPEVTAIIERINEPEEQREAAGFAKKWLVDNNLWNKEPHASKEWYIKILKWLE
jgi:CRISPR/Cas system CSM-associated protein Csm3 (group 7 of RAMP superfamily)